MHIGTSGWSYPHWRGCFYPSKLAEREWLGFYAERFSVVEVNSTFYRLPSPSTLNHWVDSVPRDFRFAVKASRYITHMKKLNEPAKTLSPFLDRVGILGARLGPLLFQLPPRWRVNRERLEAFLDALPRGLRYAFEFRDDSWHTEEIYRLLEQHRAAFCVFQLGAFRTPLRLTADLAYVRLHASAGPNQGRFDDAALRCWAAVLEQWRSDTKVGYCFFNNDMGGHAPDDAMRLKNMIAPTGKRLVQ